MNYSHLKRHTRQNIFPTQILHWIQVLLDDILVQMVNQFELLTRYEFFQKG